MLSISNLTACRVSLVHCSVIRDWPEGRVAVSPPEGLVVGVRQGKRS